MFNTPLNTVGIGNPVPPGMNSLGSGDRFDGQTKKIAKKQLPQKPFDHSQQLPLIVYKK